MRLVRSAEQLEGSKVLIMGLGTKDGGVGATLFAVKHGADVTVTDMQRASSLEKSLLELRDVPVELKLGRHDEDDFINADIIIRNPGIKRDHPLLKISQDHGVVIDSPMGIFCEIATSRYIGITGTKGKSFTTHLVQHILERTGMKAVAAGNNCVSPLRQVDDPDTVFVLELSSWQLSEMGLHGKSPHVACWLNFFPDHLNYYSSLDEYRKDKLCITKHQNANDFIVLPWDNTELRNVVTEASKLFFSTNQDQSEFIRDGCCIEDGNIVIKKDGKAEVVLGIAALPSSCRVPHHFELVLAGICCVYAYGIHAESIGSAILGFKGLPHRFERVANWRNVTFINDSAATTPESVIHALNAVNETTIVLIFGAGGYKSLSYNKLSNIVAQKCNRMILFNNDTVSKEMLKCLHSDKKDDVILVESMKEAVEKGTDYLLQNGGGTLLLSPGCSGAPFYRDLFARGEDFNKCVSEIAAMSPEHCNDGAIRR